MKHTGAKNRRYTDDHWQSVPTRARFLCFLGQIPPVGNFAKIRARGRGGLQLRGERIRPPPPFSTAKRESRPRRWDFSTAKRESRPRRWDFSTAKRESRPSRLDFSTAKRESRPSRLDFSTAKRESRPFHWDFSTAKRESRPRRWGFFAAKRESAERRPSGGVHGAGPGGAKRASFIRVRRACPFCAYPERRKNYGVCYLAFWPGKSDVCVAGRKKAKAAPPGRRRGREKPPGKGATP